VRGLSLNESEWATKLKSGNCRPKQREQLRTLNVPQTNARQHACVSCSRRFRPTATSFELRYRSCTSIHLRISFMEFNLPVLFPVNLEIIVRNVTSRKNNDVQLQNSNLKFGIMSISYIKVISEKNSINGQDPAEQGYRIWRKNVQELLSNHILVLGHFLKPHPVDLCSKFCGNRNVELTLRSRNSRISSSM